MNVHDVFVFYECLMGRPTRGMQGKNTHVCAMVAATERDDCDAYVYLSMN